MWWTAQDASLAMHQKKRLNSSNPTFGALYKPAENVANDGNIKVHADISFFP